MRCLLVFCLLVCQWTQAADLKWDGIRDGSLYLIPDQEDQLRLSWSPAWQADANNERIYLIDGRGQLRGDRPIPAEQVRGDQSWQLRPDDGPYRLEIPGYSFRSYQIKHQGTTRALFAPAKVHFCAEVGPGVELYFRVKAGEQAVLAGKYHAGIRRLQAQRVSDGRKVVVELKRHPAYWQFDRQPLPTSDRDETWRLRLLGRGKAAFWLDGTANLFAQRSQDLVDLVQAEGHVKLQVRERKLGPSPALGVALPYAMPPPSSYQVLAALHPQAAGFYSMTDVMAERPTHEDAWRQLYQQRFSINLDITLLAATGRRADLAVDQTTQKGLDAWLAATTRLGGKGLHYLSFADEPNLNYPDYTTYRNLFRGLAEQVRAFPGAREAGVRIAMPASSRLLGGPFTHDSKSRRGIDWARRLLREQGSAIDALAWHEWMVRDLLATRTYRDSVRQAAALVGLDSRGRPTKALLLDQTNLSSGSSLSPYEQDTHYAAVWWSSVVFNASADGLLTLLNWFHVADETEWPKGMVRMEANDRFVLKPVGLAQQFIQRYWLASVLSLENDAFEVDALAMADDRQRSLLGVNKVERLQQVEVALGTCARARLELLGPHDRQDNAPFSCENGQLRFQLPGQTLFALTWTAS